MPRNQAWYNLNESRPYPLSDAATLIDDNGVRLPHHIISGLHLVFPETVGRFAYVGAVAVSSSIVTVIIMGSTSQTAGSTTPIASISQAKPIDQARQFALDALVPGVGGWIAFGGGLDEEEDFQARFSTASQSLLASQAARWMPGLPIPSIAKVAGSEPLTGLVRLLGGDDIEIVKECREIPGNPVPGYDPQFCGSDELGTQVRDVIVIRLKDSGVAAERNVFDIYKGPCGQRPESESCSGSSPIEFLGPVAPDCCGRITLNFLGCTEVSEIIEEATLDANGDVVATNEACGVVIDCNLGLEDACVSKDHLPDEEGRLPNEYDDFCESISEVSESIPDELEEEEPSFSFDEAEASASADDGLPIDDDFESQSGWEVRVGEFVFQLDEAEGDILFASNSTAMRNTVVRIEDVTPIYYRKAIMTAEMRTGAVGALHNMSLIVNYRETSPASGKFEYFVAEIDWDGHLQGFKLFRIARFSGTTWTTLFSVAVPDLTLNDIYEISMEISPQENEENAFLKARLLGITDPSIDITIGPLAVNGFGPDDGLFGLGTNRAISWFRSFALENLLVP